MHKPILHVMCGVPGSGKTSFATKHAISDHDVHISRDEIRFELIGDNEYFSMESVVYEQWTQKIAWSLHAGFDTWADATHLNPKSRKTLFRQLAKYGVDFSEIEVEMIVFQIPFTVCKERNAKREGRTCVPEDALRNMANSFRPPTFDEPYIARIYTIDENGQITIQERE